MMLNYMKFDFTLPSYSAFIEEACHLAVRVNDLLETSNAAAGYLHKRRIVSGTERSAGHTEAGEESRRNRRAISAADQNEPADA
jgi:hypothetical protein